MPPAINAYPRNMPGKTFLPHWWSLDWSRAEIGFILLARNWISLAIDGRRKGEGSVDRHTYRAPHLLMHSRCTDLFYWLSDCTVTRWPPCTCMAQDWSASLCLSSKCFILVAPCPTPCTIWHHAQALLPHLFPNQSSSILNNPAKIGGHSVAPWQKTPPLTKTVSPNWWSLDWSFVEIGWYSQMVLRIAFPKVFSHLPGGLEQFAGSNSIP